MSYADHGPSRFTGYAQFLLSGGNRTVFLVGGLAETAAGLALGAGLVKTCASQTDVSESAHARAAAISCGARSGQLLIIECPVLTSN